MPLGKPGTPDRLSCPSTDVQPDDSMRPVGCPFDSPVASQQWGLELGNGSTTLVISGPDTLNPCEHPETPKALLTLDSSSEVSVEDRADGNLVILEGNEATPGSQQKPLCSTPLRDCFADTVGHVVEFLSSDLQSPVVGLSFG